MKYFRGVSIFFLLAVAIGFVGVATSRTTIAEDTAGLSWVDMVIPEIGRIKYITAGEFTAGGSKTNFPCTATESYTRGSSSASGVDTTAYGCVLPIDGASFDIANNAVVPYGSKYAQKLKDDTLDRLTYFPARNSSRIAVISNSYNFFYGGTPTLYLVDDWRSTYTIFSVDSYHNVTRQPARPYDFVLKYANGDPVSVNSNGASFSTNGEWMLIGIPGKSHALIDMDTKVVVPFAQYIDSSYALYSAVSNDGKYVAITKPHDSFRVYDTSRCQAQSGEMMSKDCESRDVLPLLKQYLNSNEVYIGDMNFIGAGSALEFKTRWLDADNVTWHYALLKMRLQGVEVSKYLAMGDSFSSGEGAFDYVEATDMFVSDEEYNVCHVSRKSYPYLLQEDLRADWFHSVACSGSESKDVSYPDSVGQYMVLGNPKSKFELIGGEDAEKAAYASAKSAYYIDNMRPGYVPQNTFVAKEHPNIATMSMGGNDIAFADIIKSCIFHGVNINQTCFSSREERESKANEIDQKISAWAHNFVDIKNSLSGSDPKLYVIGYPKIMSTDLRMRCGLNVPFDDAERLYTDMMVDYLNTAVKVAADAAGVRYVDVTDAFSNPSDQRLCSGKPEVAVNGLDVRSAVGACASEKAPEAIVCPNSFHPNELGQGLMAKAIAYRTTDLTQTMPQNSNSMAELVDKRMSFVGDVAITLQNHRITYQKDIAPALIAKGEKIQINIPKSNDDLPAKSGTSANITSHSTPLDLGQLPIASDITIMGEVTLPTDIETGYHRLIISYTDIANNTIEKYTYFYAVQSREDWDGDGIANGSDPCVLSLQSGIDQDEDGIDDACDGEYVKSARTDSAEGVSSGNSGTVSKTPTSSAQIQTHSLSLPGSNDADSVFQNPATITPLAFAKQPNVAATVSDQLHANLGNDKIPIWFAWGVGVALAIVALSGLLLKRAKS
ncbi:SGNH/GDSL hydrolase family protein [Candidatus Saccharibacteria bacterium]|nr:MAG: SGNH/GDSL hydrolase family protein [Candidatus Saccharibacteria bacterium]